MCFIMYTSQRYIVHFHIPDTLNFQSVNDLLSFFHIVHFSFDCFIIFISFSHHFLFFSHSTFQCPSPSCTPSTPLPKSSLQSICSVYHVSTSRHNATLESHTSTHTFLWQFPSVAFVRWCMLTNANKWLPHEAWKFNPLCLQLARYSNAHMLAILYLFTTILKTWDIPSSSTFLYVSVKHFKI